MGTLTKHSTPEQAKQPELSLNSEAMSYVIYNMVALYGGKNTANNLNQTTARLNDATRLMSMRLNIRFSLLKQDEQESDKPLPKIDTCNLYNVHLSLQGFSKTSEFCSLQLQELERVRAATFKDQRSFEAHGNSPMDYILPVPCIPRAALGCYLHTDSASELYASYADIQEEYEHRKALAEKYISVVNEMTYGKIDSLSEIVKKINLHVRAHSLPEECQITLNNKEQYDEKHLANALIKASSALTQSLSQIISDVCGKHNVTEEQLSPSFLEQTQFFFINNKRITAALCAGSVLLSIFGVYGTDAVLALSYGAGCLAYPGVRLLATTSENAQQLISRVPPWFRQCDISVSNTIVLSARTWSQSNTADETGNPEALIEAYQPPLEISPKSML